MFASSVQQPWVRELLVAASVLLLVSGCGGGDSQEEKGKGTAAAGQVKVLYEDDAIEPENRDAVEVIRESGVLERIADWTNEVVALPYGMEVRVTDELPEGVEDMVTEPDGRTIFVPGSFLTDTHGILAEFVEDINRDGGPPACFLRRSSTPTTSTCWRTSIS